MDIIKEDGKSVRGAASQLVKDQIEYYDGEIYYSEEALVQRYNYRLNKEPDKFSEIVSILDKRKTKGKENKKTNNNTSSNNNSKKEPSDMTDKELSRVHKTELNKLKKQVEKLQEEFDYYTGGIPKDIENKYVELADLVQSLLDDENEED